ncbi:Alb1-domain-containing protein [Hypoxylon trugodes]|uniref:Alb1-domain-containing protein n=1 Tax=Hypoxylon trugodes TaxID=326681 RepID=UPI0021A1B6F2|nr:Alb1-domain-containing protein [Hypoxylon trugodes]KAI1391248.1 Alb1-domain-containing protein [Hypoxylon trugodes]
MAKSAISKKKRAPSIHSRAARRATSPGIDTDKSLKNVQPPPESVDYRPSVLAIHNGAGITKKTKKSRNMSSKARRRHEKDQDRAAAIMERTEQKVAKSKGQARTIQSRRKTWDEVNDQIPTNKTKSEGGAGGEDDQEVSELDEEMDGGHVEKMTESALAIDRTPLQDAMDAEQNDGIL